MVTRRRWLAALVVPLAAVLACSIASAAPKLPTPGSAATIAKQVAASVKLKSLPSAVSKQVYNSPNDNAAVDYPQTKNGCLKLTTCVFGDTKSSKVLVIMGDSHAQMWIPALNRIGISRKLKVIVLYLARCPAASLDVWLAAYDMSYTQCTAVRSGWITSLNALHPVTVLLTDYTYGVDTAASSGTQTFTSAQWQAGMQTTITDLKPSKAKLAILGDIDTFNIPPPECLAAYPAQVQTCAVADPNPLRPGQQTAERAAAAAEKTLYVDPTKWLCTKTTCEPVIGSLIVYYDAFHISCKYAAYLSGVLQTALTKVL